MPFRECAVLSESIARAGARNCWHGKGFVGARTRSSVCRSSVTDERRVPRVASPKASNPCDRATCVRCEYGLLYRDKPCHPTVMCGKRRERRTGHPVNTWDQWAWCERFKTKRRADRLSMCTQQILREHRCNAPSRITSNFFNRSAVPVFSGFLTCWSPTASSVNGPSPWRMQFPRVSLRLEA